MKLSKYIECLQEQLKAGDAVVLFEQDTGDYDGPFIAELKLEDIKPAGEVVYKDIKNQRAIDYWLDGHPEYLSLPHVNDERVDVPAGVKGRVILLPQRGDA